MDEPHGVVFVHRAKVARIAQLPAAEADLGNDDARVAKRSFSHADSLPTLALVRHCERQTFDSLLRLATSPARPKIARMPRDPASNAPAALPDPKWVREVQRRLLKWYAANARKLPWRGTRDPYRVWISEI